MAIIRKWWILIKKALKQAIMAIISNIHTILAIVGFIILDKTIYEWNSFWGGISIGLTLLFLAFLIDRANN